MKSRSIYLPCIGIPKGVRFLKRLLAQKVTSSELTFRGRRALLSRVHGDRLARFWRGLEENLTRNGEGVLTLLAFWNERWYHKKTGYHQDLFLPKQLF